jgi:hypothetical protein
MASLLQELLPVWLSEKLEKKKEKKKKKKKNTGVVCLD